MDELYEAVKEIQPYYDIDKIKSWSVYVWTKPDGENDGGENVFDILKNQIVFYNKNHVIPDEVMPIIKNIQSKLLI